MIKKKKLGHWLIALLLGIRYDGVQDWGGRFLVAFTIRRGQIGGGQTFYFKAEEPVTFEVVYARVLEKRERTYEIHSIH